MPTKRTLADLYVRGTTVTLDDGGGDPVEVWVQKLTSVDQEKAVRKANAFRALLVAEAHDETSERYMEALGEVDKYDRAALVDQVAQYEVARRTQALEAEVESGERWSKENYLQGLYDAWNGGMKDRYAKDNEDEDAKRVYDAMQEYLDAVNAKIEKELKNTRTELDETRNEEQLRKKAVENVIMSRVDIQWMAEYRRCQVWLSVREPNKHGVHYFNGRNEVDELAQETLLALIEAYSTLEVDVVEGKGSGVTQDSSSSSEPPPQEETEDSSGPKVRAA